MVWDERYRMLREGEVVLEGDEVLGPDNGDTWRPVVHSIGRAAPDPNAMSHCRYRRWCEQPTTASVELNLEESGVLCNLLMKELNEGGVFSGRPVHPLMLRLFRLWERLAEANDSLMGKGESGTGSASSEEKTEPAE